MAEIWKGAPVADALTEELKERAGKLKVAGIVPCLAVLRLGDDPSAISYERGILKRCEKVGIEVRHYLLSELCEDEELFATLCEINEDEKIHGCIFFRPLKDKAQERMLCELLKPAKDVDCATSGSLAAVFSGEGEGYAPCTAEAVVQMLKFYGEELRGKNIAVIGRSLVIGRPVSMLLQRENATVTMCHSKTRNTEEICAASDIIVAAAGRAGLVGEGYASANSVIIDVGINVDEQGRLCGDADFDALEPLCRAITPVPGGVGAVTTAILAKHVIEAAEKHLK
ncbi:MAG: bifunctional 5,10-methylenetetrahydrofolate dehydrogenase/5,10-methenyltetrahydrofolate cyclohydrolase [Clostridiales bacterium]|nr:bifunctional 5,10-methylenetetrahydrofolate dehydrogenase/5,10-methenyltetrahydrofolate cyclohydrolase [Clostridiales bacterium]